MNQSTIQEYQKTVEKLLPHNLVASINKIKSPPYEIYPAEHEIVKSSTKKRIEEFSAGRYCARNALDQHGIYNFPILAGENREPLFPANLAGSITHCKDLAGAVVASRTIYKSLGFDIEQIKPLKYDISRFICTEEENEFIKSQTSYSKETAILLFFSMKEAIYKCVFQGYNTRLGFKDCTILSLQGNTAGNIRITKKELLPLTRQLDIRFALADSYIFSIACIYNE